MVGVHGVGYKGWWGSKCGWVGVVGVLEWMSRGGGGPGGGWVGGGGVQGVGVQGVVGVQWVGG